MSYSQNTSHLLDYQKLDGSLITFNLSIQHTIIKKFDLIFKQVNTILELDSEFHILYDEFISLMIIDDSENINFERIKELLPIICDTVDKYAEQLHYWDFSYTAPKKLSEYKLHIDKNGYLEIMKASVRSKFICVPVTLLRNKNTSLIRYIYNYICREMIESGVMFTLERIIDSIVLSTSARGIDQKSQLWLFFQTSKGLDPQNLALRERNAILYKGLPSIATGRNPISWFVSIARTSINFQMKDKINEINIQFSAPIETPYENATDMLKVFIYEEVTSNRKLKKLFNEYPWAVQLINGYVFPITNWIASPFISEVFNVNNLNISHLVNILLLNLFTYKFLTKKEGFDSILFKMLSYTATIKSEDLKINDSSFKYPIPLDFKNKYVTNSHIFNGRVLAQMIKDKMIELDFLNNTIYTQEQIENLFKVAIKNLLNYDYYDYKGVKIVINPIILTDEYIDYVYKLLTHQYNDTVEEARQYLRS